MKEEEINALAQLLTMMKGVVERLEKAQRIKDSETFYSAKQEILKLQEQIKRIL